MSEYYLKTEKNYWLKVLLDGFLLSVSFLLAYFIKRGHFNIEYDFRKFIPVLVLTWIFVTFFSKKFMKTKKDNFINYIKPFIYSNLFLIFILSLILYVLGWYNLSRFIVYGSLGFFMILEIAFISFNFILSKESRNGKRNLFSIFFFIFESSLLMSIYILFYLFKKKPIVPNIVLTENYLVLLLGIFFLWLLTALRFHKFKIIKKANYIKTVTPFIKSEIFLIGITAFIIFFLKLAVYSRLIILGSLGIFSFIEVIIVTLYYLYSNPEKSGETGGNDFYAKLAEDKPKFPENNKNQEKLIHDFPISFIKSVSIKDKLKNLYFKKFRSLYEFIEKNINLNDIDLIDSEIIYTSDPYNIEIINDSSLFFLLNFQKVNNFRRINKFLISVNEKVKPGGYFISRFESKYQRKIRIFKKFPFEFAKFYYLIDFLYKRACPKLPVLKNIYFIISRGKNRVISLAECVGRLYFCGFELVAVKEIDNFYCFIARKIKNPTFDKNPSYGFLFKQKRIGKHGKLFHAYKLRTMHPYSEFIHEYLYKEKKLDDRGKISKDFRITGWGRFFRKYYIDELPMIYNFLKGDLKLVGVRPLSETFFNTYPEYLRKLRIKHKPGLIPPYYVDLPGSIEEVWESERKYLEKSEKNPLKTDIVYIFKALNNIVFYRARSQ